VDASMCSFDRISSCTYCSWGTADAFVTMRPSRPEA
jgi:hypothetical protein